MKKLIPALLALMFFSYVPKAEASVLGKILVVAKVPVLVVRNVALATAGAVYLALLETELNWQEDSRK